MKYRVFVPIGGYEIVQVEATSSFDALNKGYDLVAEMLDGKNLNPADRVKIQTSQEDIENGEYAAVLRLIAELIE